MKFTMIGAIMVCLLVVGCNKPSAIEEESKQAIAPKKEVDKPPVEDQGIKIGDPVTFNNLSIFPIISKKQRDEDKYITLDEGLREELVVIAEVGSHAANQDSPNPQTENNTERSANPNQRNNRRSVPEESNNNEPEVNDNSCDDDNEVKEQAISNRPHTPTNNAPPKPVEKETSTENKSDNNDPDDDDLDDLFQEPNTQENSNDANIQFRQGSFANRSADVNTVMVTNKSDKPLYLMPGEIIYGGQQDRAVQEQIVIALKSGPLPVKVFCVEQGRWEGRDVAMYSKMIKALNSNAARKSSFAVSQKKSAGMLAKEANDGGFVASPGIVNKSVRLALQKDGKQGEVWEKVATSNARNTVSSKSTNFVGNYAEENAVKKLDPYLKALQEKVSKTDRIVGVIVAINGKFDQVEVFQTTPLFKKLWPKLLKNYALDASIKFKKDAPVVKADSLSCAKADQYLTKMLNSQGKESAKGRGSVATVQNESEEFVTFQCASFGTKNQSDKSSDIVYPQSEVWQELSLRKVKIINSGRATKSQIHGKDFQPISRESIFGQDQIQFSGFSK